MVGIRVNPLGGYFEFSRDVYYSGLSWVQRGVILSTEGEYRDACRKDIRLSHLFLLLLH